ncbi:MAG: HAD family phosphatase [Spirochaetes bacterium]|nr:HAD family phosphatase [Spirochaetota bacterium]
MDTCVYFNNRYLQSLLINARLIILDMNGLIIDDESIQLRSVNQTLQPCGLHINEAYWINNCVGKRADAYLLRILLENGVRDKKYSITDLVKEKNKHYHSLITHNINKMVRSGVYTFINFLSRSTYFKTALATSALPDEIETVLGENALNLKNIFQYIVTGSDVINSKPDPEIYKKVSELSDIQPQYCLVFEDSEPGVTAAFHAGMLCIAIPNRFTASQNFNHARCIIDNLTHAAKIIN